MAYFSAEVISEVKLCERAAKGALFHFKMTLLKLYHTMEGRKFLCDHYINSGERWFTEMIYLIFLDMKVSVSQTVQVLSNCRIYQFTIQIKLRPPEHHLNTSQNYCMLFCPWSIWQFIKTSKQSHDTKKEGHMRREIKREYLSFKQASCLLTQVHPCCDSWATPWVMLDSTG